jgi:hypothetical protein
VRWIRGLVIFLLVLVVLVTSVVVLLVLLWVLSVAGLGLVACCFVLKTVRCGNGGALLRLPVQAEL